MVLINQGGSLYNPAAMLAFSRDITSTLRFLGNIAAELQIAEGLSFKTVLGFDKSLSARKSAYSGNLVAFQHSRPRKSLF